MPTDHTIATPQGEPDKRDRDDWLLLALISLDDIQEAKNYWEKHHEADPLGVRDLLLTGGDWTWDKDEQEYKGKAGHVMDDTHLKSLSNLLMKDNEHTLRDYAGEMARGEINIAKWQAWMAYSLKRHYITQAALASGGFDRLADSPSLIKVAEGKPDVPPGLAYAINRLFSSFAKDVADGRMKTVSGITERAASYAEAAMAVLEAVRVASHKAAVDDKGRPLFLYYRNVLNPAVEHCETRGDTMGCVEVSQLGWQPIGSLPAISDRSCGPRCACSWEFSLTGNATESAIH